MSNMSDKELCCYLHKNYDYDHKSGIFTRTEANHGKGGVGSEAGWDDRGYKAIRIKGIKYYCHRLAFLYMLGTFPDDQVDHIDGNKSNNKWLNLRPATSSQNQHNIGTSKNNTSGVKNISWNSGVEKWETRLSYLGKRITVGYFTSLQEAEKAVKETRRLLHKEFTHAETN